MIKRGVGRLPGSRGCRLVARRITRRRGSTRPVAVVRYRASRRRPWSTLATYAAVIRPHPCPNAVESAKRTRESCSRPRHRGRTPAAATPTTMVRHLNANGQLVQPFRGLSNKGTKRSAHQKRANAGRTFLTDSSAVCFPVLWNRGFRHLSPSRAGNSRHHYWHPCRRTPGDNSHGSRPYAG